jgi:hypothetical protein
MIKSFKINNITHTVNFRRRGVRNRTAIYDPRTYTLTINTHYFDEEASEDTDTPRQQQEIFNDFLHEIFHCLFTHTAVEQSEVLVQTCANALQQIITSALFDWDVIIRTLSDEQRIALYIALEKRTTIPVAATN